MLRWKDIWNYISTPLVVTVIGGLIVAFLTPPITQIWTNTKSEQQPIQQAQQVQSPPAQPVQPPPAQQAPALPAQQIQPRSVFESLEAYCKRLNDLDDRFYERDEFLGNMRDKKVEWTGFVHSVAPLRSGKTSLFIVTNPEDFPPCGANIYFKGSQMYEKLSHLRTNDRVQVTGVYIKERGDPQLEGITVNRLDN